MAYSHTNSKGNTYYLHANKKQRKSDGSTYYLYYFSKEVKDNALDAVPDGYVVGETSNGMLVLKRAA